MEQCAALNDVVVADFTRVLAGPLASMMLADLGADVVKVERPESGDGTREWGPPFTSDGESAYFLSVNRNKRSVVLDLETKAGQQAARALCERADVVIENFRGDLMERAGLGYETLRTRLPGLVYCRISGFGSESDLSSYDFIAQAVGGLMSITGYPDGPPTKTGVAVVDVVLGLHATIGILAALRHRDVTGQGQRVDVNLLSSCLALLANQSSSYLMTGVPPTRMGNQHPSIAPYETLATATRPIAVAIGTDEHFARFCQVLGAPHLATHSRWRTNADRVSNRASMVEHLEARLAELPAEEWVDLLQRAGLACGLVNDIGEAFGLAARLGLTPVQHLPADGDSPHPQVANPVGLSASPTSYRRRPPRLGEHTEEILAWLDPAADGSARGASEAAGYESSSWRRERLYNVSSGLSAPRGPG